MKKYIVRLTIEEGEELQKLVNTGKAAAYKRQHAQILLKADISEQGEKWTDAKISEAFDVNIRTVERIRQRLVEHGLETAVNRAKHRRTRKRRLDGEQEAHLIGLSCSEPPDGRARWTFQLLADKMVELKYVDTVSDSTVYRVLKKNEIKPWQSKEWCIPPEANADFVCKMEDTLEIYKRPYDPLYPIVCMDESSKQQIKEVRTPILINQAKCYDTEYERNGVSNLFIFFEPLAGQRDVIVTERRTAVDWAYQVRNLVDKRYPEAEKIIMVMDNLNTHTGTSLYKAFEPQEARRILDKIEIHYTPKHGSWLNMAEIEFSILSRQCLERRIPDRETLKKEVAAWVEKRNNYPKPMEWRFTTEDARIKLKRLYTIIDVK